MIALFETIVFSWYFSGFLFGLFLFNEDDHPIFSTIVGLFFIGLSLNLLGIVPTPQEVGIGLVLYIPLGLLYALWKYRTVVNTAVAQYNDKQIQKWKLDEFQPSKMTGQIAGWTLMWPISLPFNFLHQILAELKTFIATKMRGLIESIYNSAMASKIDRE